MKSSLSFTSPIPLFPVFRSILCHKQWLNQENNRANCAEYGIHIKVPLFVNKRKPKKQELWGQRVDNGPRLWGWKTYSRSANKTSALNKKWKFREITQQDQGCCSHSFPKSGLEPLLVEVLVRGYQTLSLLDIHKHTDTVFDDEGTLNDGSHQSKHLCFHLFFIFLLKTRIMSLR